MGRPPLSGPRGERPRAVTGESGVGVLSAIVGHELNNIAVPLQAFTELALESIRDSEPGREYLHEMRIAIGRIKALADDLGRLGEFDSVRSVVPVSDCFAAQSDSGEPLVWNIDWQSESGAAVDVDRYQARRATEMLARIGAEGARKTRPALAVTQHVPAAAFCAACPAPVATGSWIQVTLANTRIRRDEIREPLSAAHPERLFRRLSLAVLVHSAHCAGGHILLDEARGLLSLVFSVR